MRLHHRVLGDGDAVHIVAAASDERLLDLEPAQSLRVHEADQPFDLGHHLGADAVAGKQQEFRHGNAHLVAEPRGLLKRRARVGKLPDDGRQMTDTKRQTTDDRRQTTDDRRQTIDIKLDGVAQGFLSILCRPSSVVRFAVTSISTFISGRSRPATTNSVAAGRTSANISPQTFSTVSASAGSTM